MAPKPRAPGWWTTASFSWSVFSVFPRCAISENLRMLNTDKWAHFCFASHRKAEAFGTKVTFDGWENRRDHKGPVVYLCNHMSTLETILLPAILVPYGALHIVVKASLVHLPGMEKCAAHMGLLPVTRKDPRKDLQTMFDDGVARIKAGGSFLVFPQGTRQSEWNERKFSSIGAKVAEKAGVPVVPVAVKTDMLPTRGKGMFKDFGTVDPSRDVRIAAGPVITGSAKEMHSASTAWIGAKLKEWGLA